MSIAHDLRNWLHQMLLALQVGHVTMLIQYFADDVEVIGLDEAAVWQGRDAWGAFLRDYLEPLQIGELNVRLLNKPEVTLDSTEARSATVRWHMLFQRIGMSDPLWLDCDVSVVRTQGQWLARRLQLHHLPH